jgi:hypothetical protein
VSAGRAALPETLAQAAETLVAKSPGFWSVLWSVLKLPVQIVLIGGAVLLIGWASTLFHFSGLERLGAALSGNAVLPAFVAILFFVVGLSFAVFLWWIVDRYFSIISSGKLTPDQLASLKDLPVGLPEGTIRAILALIVGIIGLPLLMFQKTLNLDPAIAGYVNGIIAGVFGFYFGSRTTGVPTKALTQIADANGRAVQAESALGDAQQAVADAQAQTGILARAATFSPTVGKLSRELSIGSTILDVIAPALPSGLLPAGLGAAVTTAKTALDAIKGVTSDTVTNDQQNLLQSAVGTIAGNGGVAALGSLITKAAPMLAGLGISGLTPVSAIATLLSVGAQLGSQAYQRWHARVLAAPLAQGLVEFGTVTPDDVHAALEDAPIFAKAFATERNRPGFDADLANWILGDDALDVLWQHYGVATATRPALFASKAELESGVSQFGQVLLASRAAADIPATLATSVNESLSKAQNPALQPATGVLTPTVVNQIINAASKASAPDSKVPEDAHAAFDALITLVGNSQQPGGIDLTGALAEIPP